MTTVGFVGLGAMGNGIVPRLMAGGHEVTGWNRTRAAEALGISRVTVWKRMRRHGLSEPGPGA